MARISQMPTDPVLCRTLPYWKRSMDIFGALIGLAVLSPLFLVIACLTKTTSPGPVFFKQQRVGFGLKQFTLWKFRTMAMSVDTSQHRKHLVQLINGLRDLNETEYQPMVKLDNKLQVTIVGRFLRKTYLDELPQLINVLKGEMSLVGPRPAIPYEVKEYLRWHAGRFDVLPGMSGLWQVSGKNRLTFKEMVRLDIRYIRRLSFWLDLTILIRTPSTIAKEIWGCVMNEKTEAKEIIKNA